MSIYTSSLPSSSFVLDTTGTFDVPSTGVLGLGARYISGTMVGAVPWTDTQFFDALSGDVTIEWSMRAPKWHDFWGLGQNPHPFVFYFSIASGSSAQGGLFYNGPGATQDFWWSQATVDFSGTIESRSIAHDVFREGTIVDPSKTWSRLAVVRKDMGGGVHKVQMYRNGIPNSSYNNFGPPIPITGSPGVTGACDFGGFRGVALFNTEIEIDEIRISNYALNQSELLGYQAPRTLGFFTFDGVAPLRNTIGSSSITFGPEGGVNQESTQVPGYIGNGWQLNGPLSATVPTNELEPWLRALTDEFTVEFTMKQHPTNHGLYEWSDATNTVTYPMFVTFETSTGTIQFYLNGPGIQGHSQFYRPTIDGIQDKEIIGQFPDYWLSPASWNRIAITQKSQQGDGTYKVQAYINGVQWGTYNTYSPPADMTACTSLKIRVFGNGNPSYNATGIIDSFKFSNYVVPIGQLLPQPGPPTVTSPTVSQSFSTTGSSTPVTVAGTGVTGATIHIELDGTEVASISTDGVGGYSTAITSPTGSHIVRVHQVVGADQSPSVSVNFAVNQTAPLTFVSVNGATSGTVTLDTTGSLTLSGSNFTAVTSIGVEDWGTSFFAPSDQGFFSPDLGNGDTAGPFTIVSPNIITISNDQMFGTGSSWVSNWVFNGFFYDEWYKIRLFTGGGTSSYLDAPALFSVTGPIYVQSVGVQVISASAQYPWGPGDNILLQATPDWSDNVSRLFTGSWVSPSGSIATVSGTNVGGDIQGLVTIVGSGTFDILAIEGDATGTITFNAINFAHVDVLSVIDSPAYDVLFTSSSIGGYPGWTNAYLAKSTTGTGSAGHFHLGTTGTNGIWDIIDIAGQVFQGGTGPWENSNVPNWFSQGYGGSTYSGSATQNGNWRQVTSFTGSFVGTWTPTSPALSASTDIYPHSLVVDCSGNKYTPMGEGGTDFTSGVQRTAHIIGWGTQFIQNFTTVTGVDVMFFNDPDFQVLVFPCIFKVISNRDILVPMPAGNIYGQQNIFFGFHHSSGTFYSRIFDYRNQF